MLDIVDFITERGGNPQLIKQSQRRRHAPEEVVDEVIALYEDHRRSMSSRTTASKLTALTDMLQQTTKIHRSKRKSMISRNKLAQRKRRKRMRMTY
jgi:seryl-tRNA synthetase